MNRKCIVQLEFMDNELDFIKQKEKKLKKNLKDKKGSYDFHNNIVNTIPDTPRGKLYKNFLNDDLKQIDEYQKQLEKLSLYKKANNGLTIQEVDQLFEGIDFGYNIPDDMTNFERELSKTRYLKCEF